MSECGKRPAISQSQASSESFKYGLADRTNDFRVDYLPSFFSSFFSSPNVSAWPPFFSSFLSLSSPYTRT